MVRCRPNIPMHLVGDQGRLRQILTNVVGKRDQVHGSRARLHRRRRHRRSRARQAHDQRLRHRLRHSGRQARPHLRDVRASGHLILALPRRHRSWSLDHAASLGAHGRRDHRREQNRHRIDVHGPVVPAVVGPAAVQGYRRPKRSSSKARACSSSTTRRSTVRSSRSRRGAGAWKRSAFRARAMRSTFVAPPRRPYVLRRRTRLPDAGCNGVELAESMKHDPRTRHLPLVLLTSVGHLTDMEHITSLFAAILVKPARSTVLRQKIATIVAAAKSGASEDEESTGIKTNETPSPKAQAALPAEPSLPGGGRERPAGENPCRRRQRRQSQAYRRDAG